MEISKKLFTFKIGENGLVLARNASSLYSSSAPVKKFSGLQMEISEKLFTLKMGGNGLALARNASSWYSSSAPVQVVSPFLPSPSTWTVLAELGDLASMISRRGRWPKNQSVKP